MAALEDVPPGAMAAIVEASPLDPIVTELDVVVPTVVDALHTSVATIALFRSLSPVATVLLRSKNT